MNGFMLCIHNLDRNKSLDLFLHTPGGDGDATENIVHYLLKMFKKDIRAFIPQIAMSAGTIMACACKEIYIGNHSNLGPVDPQVNGIAALTVLDEIETAYEEMAEDDIRAFIWRPILSNYTPGFIQRCMDAKESSERLVTGFLKNNMFFSLQNEDRDKKAKHIFDKLSERGTEHSKHIRIEELEKMGLEVRQLEDPTQKELQDLVLTVHHCMMFALANTGATKIIENHLGRRWVKQLFAQIAQPVAPSGPLQLQLPPEIMEALKEEMKNIKK